MMDLEIMKFYQKNNKEISEKISYELESVRDRTQQLLKIIKDLKSHKEHSKSGTLKELTELHFKYAVQAICNIGTMVSLFEKYYSFSDQLTICLISDITKIYEKFASDASIMKSTELGKLLLERNILLNEATEKTTFEYAIGCDVFSLCLVKLINIISCNCYFSYKINDYNKQKKVIAFCEDLVKEFIEIITGSKYLKIVFDRVQQLKDFSNILDVEHLKKEFYKSTDDNLCKIELQGKLLKQGLLQQNILINVLQEINDDLEKTLDKINE